MKIELSEASNVFADLNREFDKIDTEFNKLESDNAKLRKALADLVGMDGKDNLNALRKTMDTFEIPAQERTNINNAISALLETIPE